MTARMCSIGRRRTSDTSNGIDPQAYLASIFARTAEGYPINQIDELLPRTADLSAEQRVHAGDPYGYRIKLPWTS